jgi:hypothetical protein
MEIEKIKLLRKYIPRLSMAEAKRVLAESSGDSLAALKASISQQELSELQNSIISKIVVSKAAGTGRGMPNQEEAAVLQFLQSNQSETN